MRTYQIANALCVLVGIGISLYFYRKLERRRGLLKIAEIKIKEGEFLMDWIMLIVSITVFFYLGFSNKICPEIPKPF